MNTKTIAPHVTAAISAFGAGMALLHPGFSLPPFVQGWVTTVFAFVGGLMELVHVVKHHNMKAALLYAQQMAAQATATK